MKYVIGSFALALLTVNPALAQSKNNEMVTASHDGLTLEAGDLEINLGGRLHIDGVVFDDPATLSSGVTEIDVRRARLELSGKVGELVRFSVSREFSGGAKGWRNLWLGIEPVKNVELRGGNFIVPFAIEDMQSSNTMPFAERSLASALTPGYGLGGAIYTSSKNWSASLGYFTDPLANDNGRSPERGDGFAGRVTFAPINKSGNVLHFAFAGERRNFSTTETLRISGDAGSTFAPTLLSTGGLAGLDRLSAYNAELGGTFGPVQLLAFSTWVEIDRTALPDLSFSGQTIQAAWLITGGQYRYTEKGGVLGGPDFNRKSNAIEIATRISQLDLNDIALRGKGQAVSIGANWYLNRNFRIMLGYTNSRVNFPGGGVSVTNNVGVARFQMNF